MKHQKLKLQSVQKKLFGFNLSVPKFTWQDKEPEWRKHNQHSKDQGL